MSGSGLTVGEFVNSATTEDGNSPGDTASMEANTQGDVKNWVADVSTDTYDILADVATNAAGDAADTATRVWLEWVLDNPRLVGGGVALVVLRSYAGLADSAT